MGRRSHLFEFADPSARERDQRHNCRNGTSHFHRGRSETAAAARRTVRGAVITRDVRNRHRALYHWTCDRVSWFRNFNDADRSQHNDNRRRCFISQIGNINDPERRFAIEQFGGVGRNGTQIGSKKSRGNDIFHTVSNRHVKHDRERSE